MSVEPRSLRVLSAAERERFAAKVSRLPNGCWNWIGAKRDGYGMFWLDGSNAQAHRLALFLAGADVPSNMVVDHICRNRACVNPAHLRSVDRHTNVHENSASPSHLNSLKTHCPRGHALTGENVVLDRGKRRCRECKAVQLRELRLRGKCGPKDAEPGGEATRPGE